MTIHFDTLERLRRYDWRRAQIKGLDMAMERVRAGQTVGDREIWWALLCDAIKASAIAHKAPPWLGMPSKSSMPDAPDEVTQWQMMMAYVRGQIEEMPVEVSRPPQPSAEEITRAEMVLQVWHIAALRNLGDWKRMRKALYLSAAGCPHRKIRAVTGLDRRRIHDAKDRAMKDMLDFVKGLDKRTEN